MNETSDAQLRDARPSDIASIVAMIGASNRLHGYETALFDAVAAERDLFGPQAILSGAVAETSDVSERIGVVLWCEAYESAYAARGAYIVDIYVADKRRRKGLGRALLAHAAARVRARGGVYLWWASAPWNAAARDFYADLGASDESVHAHALTFDAFQRLADAAGDA